MAKKDKSNAPSRSDERNIVEDSHVDLEDLEHQLVIIWEQNRGMIIGGVVLVFAVFLGFQGMKYYQRSAEAKIQSGYQEAIEDTAKLAWADKESGHALSGFAYKELADAAMADGDSAEAEALYRKSIKSSEAAIKEAARMGLALSLLDQGENEEAKSVLREIADDANAISRAEAQFRLAQIATNEGDAETAKSYIDAIPVEDFFWKSRASSLEPPR